MFDLSSRTAIIAGGAGLLGPKHVEAIAAAGGVPIVVDLRGDAAEAVARDARKRYGVPAMSVKADITQPSDVAAVLERVLERFGRIDILVNNAANNPKVEDPHGGGFSRLERFSVQQWNADIAVGLTGAFLCSQVIGTEMARRGSGVIVNIASEYGVIAPDQRLYRVDGLAEGDQPVKPISYSVVKSGLLGMTRYLATYWATRGLRVNAITVGGIENGQDRRFLAMAAERIPLARMARANEYQGALLYLCSDASSFMTGSNVIVDGGKSVW
jgi:NAD(P)-dependent dehydrogenase (short-subunit alcohol dehydrogenase family)